MLQKTPHAPTARSVPMIGTSGEGIISGGLRWGVPTTWLTVATHARSCLSSWASQAILSFSLSLPPPLSFMHISSFFGLQLLYIYHSYSLSLFSVLTCAAPVYPVSHTHTHTLSCALIFFALWNWMDESQNSPSVIAAVCKYAGLGLLFLLLWHAHNNL